MSTSITVQNNIQTISGRITEEREEEREGYLIRERRAGFFRRSLQLPQGVDESNITARFDKCQQNDGNGGQLSDRQGAGTQSGSS